MNKHKSNKIKENSNTVRHLIMGQIITTQNLVAIKEVRHAGQSHIELKSQVQYWTAPMSQHDDEWAGAVWVVPGKVYCAVITNKHDERITFFNKIYEPAVPEPYLCECCRIHVLASGRPVSGSYIIYCGQVKQGLQGGGVGCYFIEDNRIKFELWFRPSTD